ncbi:hypothetical protein T4A_7736 [Trichinella pseudospiralis]|uniref:Uncharacterized protein n=1 Tax=Trichinella pseudospiralis TaxID=6337 RepID=A0A0V1ERS6_TRIPS|nr:hypothetical protein T4A_7736 [Trichinella pseudospiralis]
MFALNSFANSLLADNVVNEKFTLAADQSTIFTYFFMQTYQIMHATTTKQYCTGIILESIIHVKAPILGTNNKAHGWICVELLELQTFHVYALDLIY